MTTLARAVGDTFLAAKNMNQHIIIATKKLLIMSIPLKMLLSVQMSVCGPVCIVSTDIETPLKHCFGKKYMIIYISTFSNIFLSFFFIFTSEQD